MWFSSSNLFSVIHTGWSQHSKLLNSVCPSPSLVLKFLLPASLAVSNVSLNRLLLLLHLPSTSLFPGRIAQQMYGRSRFISPILARTVPKGVLIASSSMCPGEQAKSGKRERIGAFIRACKSPNFSCCHFFCFVLRLKGFVFFCFPPAAMGTSSWIVSEASRIKLPSVPLMSRTRKQSGAWPWQKRRHAAGAPLSSSREAAMSVSGCAA